MVLGGFQRGPINGPFANTQALRDLRLGKPIASQRGNLASAHGYARSAEIPMKPMLAMWRLDIVPHNNTGGVEIERDDGTTDIIRTLLRPLPRNGGSVRLLICPDCLTPRRGLYGWEPGGRFTTSVVRSNWRCRACNKLRYASEGGALVVRGAIARMFEATVARSRPARPEPWYPEIIDVTEIPKHG
jgi:hypothetical protein